MRRVTWLEATHGDPVFGELWEFLGEQVERLAAGRVETSVRHAPVAAGGIRTPANRLMSDAAILAAALDVEADPEAGADAVVVGCWGAPTTAVRSALGVPVTSLSDASVRTVGSLARRAVVVTVSPTLVPIFTDDLTALGATGFLPTAPVRSYAPETDLFDVVKAITDPSDLVERFDAVAAAAVEDGADAIVVGCGYLAPIFTAHGYTHVGAHPDVPVLDCNRLALTHALQLLDLQENGIGPTPRGYVRPAGDRATALTTAAALLTGGPTKGRTS